MTVVFTDKLGQDLSWRDVSIVDEIELGLPAAFLLHNGDFHTHSFWELVTYEYPPETLPISLINFQRFLRGSPLWRFERSLNRRR